MKSGVFQQQSNPRGLRAASQRKGSTRPAGAVLGPTTNQAELRGRDLAAGMPGVSGGAAAAPQQLCSPSPRCPRCPAERSPRQRQRPTLQARCCRSQASPAQPRFGGRARARMLHVATEVRGWCGTGPLWFMCPPRLPPPPAGTFNQVPVTAPTATPRCSFLVFGRTSGTRFKKVIKTCA